MNDRVLVLGTFDILHFGHMEYLRECSRLGLVTVGLSTDANASRKRQPIMSYLERERALYMSPRVDRVVPKSEVSAKPIIYDVRPDVLTYGSDWGGFAWLLENKIDLYFLVEQAIDLVEIHNRGVMSTTEIIDRIFLHGA